MRRIIVVLSGRNLFPNYRSAVEFLIAEGQTQVEFSDSLFAQELWAEARERFGIRLAGLLVVILDGGRMIWAAGDPTERELQEAVSLRDEGIAPNQEFPP